MVDIVDVPYTFANQGGERVPAAELDADFIALQNAVNGLPSNATPLANGTATPGTSNKFAREGHVHPTSGPSGTLAVANGGTGVATLTGIVKGNGTAPMSAAISGTDYVAPSDLTPYTLLSSINTQTFATRTLAVATTNSVRVTAIILSGRSAGNDGGGGIFIFTAGSVVAPGFTDAGGRVYNLAPWVVMTPRQFGATGTSGTDDSSALNAAFATGGDIFLPRGDSYDGQTLIMGVAGTTLYGEGTLRQFGGGTTTTSFLAITAANCILRDVTLDGNTTNVAYTYNSAIVDISGAGVRFWNVKAKNGWSMGIRIIAGGDDFKCYIPTVTNCGDFGIFALNTARGLIDNPTVSGCGQKGIRLGGGVEGDTPDWNVRSSQVTQLVNNYALLTAASATGPSVTVRGNSLPGFKVTISGTFGGTSVTIRKTVGGVTTTIQTFTTAGTSGTLAIPGGAIIQAVVTGGSPSGLNCTLIDLQDQLGIEMFIGADRAKFTAWNVVATSTFGASFGGKDCEGTSGTVTGSTVFSCEVVHEGVKIRGLTTINPLGTSVAMNLNSGISSRVGYGCVIDDVIVRNHTNTSVGAITVNPDGVVAINPAYTISNINLEQCRGPGVIINSGGHGGQVHHIQVEMLASYAAFSSTTTGMSFDAISATMPSASGSLSASWVMTVAGSGNSYNGFKCDANQNAAIGLFIQSVGNEIRNSSLRNVTSKAFQEVGGTNTYFGNAGSVVGGGNPYLTDPSSYFDSNTNIDLNNPSFGRVWADGGSNKLRVTSILDGHNLMSVNDTTGNLLVQGTVTPSTTP